MSRKHNKGQAKTTPAPKNNKLYNYILLSAFALFIILFTTSKLTNEDDYFWHFATGRYIVETGSIPSNDVFSFSSAGTRWLVTEWGWDVMTFIIFKYLGYAGISILCTLTFLIMFFVYYVLLRRFDVSETVIIFFFILFLFAIFERLTPRPHIVTYLFFVLLTGILINYKYFGRKNLKQLYFIPLIFLFWANMHIGCMIGIAIFGLYILTELIVYFRPVKFSTKELPPFTKLELIRLGIVFFISILAMFVNPHGIMTYVYAVSSQTNANMLHEAVMEWISPFDPKATGRLYNTLYIILLFTGLVILYRSYRKKELFPALFYTIFALNSVRAIRFTVDYLVLIPVFLINSFNYTLEKIQSVKIKAFIFDNPAMKVIISLVLLYLIVNIPNNKLYHSYLEYARFAGIGLDSNYYPVAMFNFIRENNIQDIGERPFNTFECGGFFLWNFQGKKDFFDSRDLNDSIMNEYQVIYSKNPGYEKKIQGYNFDYSICVVPDIVSEPDLMRKNVISYFCKSREWKLIFWNDRSLLFVRDLPKFSGIISKYEYKYVTPFNFYFQRDILDKALVENKDIVKAEIDRKFAEEPSNIFLRNILRNYGNKLK
jgi:hypothetical protein